MVPSKPADRRLAQRHGIHRAGHPRQGDHVAHVVLVFNQDQNAVQHILDDSLSGQADGHAGYARAGQKRPQVEVENVLHDLEKGQEGNDDDAGGADDGGQGADLGAAGDPRLSRCSASLMTRVVMKLTTRISAQA